MSGVLIRLCLTGWIIIVSLLMHGCNPDSHITIISTDNVRTQTVTTQPLTPTIRPNTHKTPKNNRQVTPTPTWHLCSPLENIPTSGLLELISNPFAPPPPGYDYPHQGIDLAIVDPKAGISTEGHTVTAIFDGQVAANIQNRFPYGYAILIETNLDSIPEDFFAGIPLPTPVLHPQEPINLTCPTVETENITGQVVNQKGETNHPGQAGQSLYILYAHLKETSDLNLGDTVHCGQPLGQIGSSGNAINPHLHLEIRVGPSEFRTESMAHYDNSSSDIEMATYCKWRVSGFFQLINPMDVLSMSP